VLKPGAVAAVVVALGGAGAALGAEASALPASLLDPSQDQIRARTVVPDDVRQVGEVRLVTRGDATVVQTALATKVLSRVVGEIRKKESANWPEGAPGHDDMLRYLAGLEQAAATVRAGRGAGADRRVHLLIEFAASPTTAAVAFASFEGDPRDGKIDVRRPQPIATLALAPTYVHRNMRLILADSFHVSESDVGRLGPLGPIAP
jgi:hypothetical protein